MTLIPWDFLISLHKMSNATNMHIESDTEYGIIVNVWKKWHNVLRGG